jgi:predicted component of type VI protein secretion system
LATKTILKTAAELLDRFYRDAEGRTNRQLDVYFILEDLGIPRDRADPAMEYLTSRGLVNAFGTDTAFLTDKGAACVVDEVDLATLPKEMRDFNLVTPAPQPAAPPAPPARKRPPRAILTHIDDDGGEHIVPLGWVCTIGRSEGNEVRVNDARASKRHAEIRFEDGRYVLHDLNSANGTLVNGQYMGDTHVLRHEDEVVIGRTMLLYLQPTVLAAPAGPSPAWGEAEATLEAAMPSTAPSAHAPLAATERPAPALQLDHLPLVEVLPARAPQAIPSFGAEPASGDDFGSLDVAARLPEPTSDGLDFLRDPEPVAAAPAPVLAHFGLDVFADTAPPREPAPVLGSDDLSPAEPDPGLEPDEALVGRGTFERAGAWAPSADDDLGARTAQHAPAEAPDGDLIEETLIPREGGRGWPPEPTGSFEEKGRTGTLEALDARAESAASEWQETTPVEGSGIEEEPGADEGPALEEHLEEQLDGTLAVSTSAMIDEPVSERWEAASADLAGAWGDTTPAEAAANDAPNGEVQAGPGAGGASRSALFLETLAELRRLLEEAPDRERASLLDAVARLERHPWVRSALEALDA